MELYCTPKVDTLQLNTVGNSWNTRTRPTRTVSEHQLLQNSSNGTSCGTHSLPFLQSESFQTHVGTIHRRAIGPLAHHNGTSSYSPSLTCHLPVPTIGCLHSNDSLTTLLYVSRSPVSIEISVYCCFRNYSACLHCYVAMSVNIVIRKYCRVSKETCNNKFK
jgi:hypothetical protein